MTSFDDLPPETATEILLKLPVKSLIQSTAVNKTWYSLITNPNFISTQIRLSIVYNNVNDNAVLIVPPVISQQNYCSLVSAKTSPVIEKFEIPFNTKSGGLKLIASVNGLLLLTDLHVHYANRVLYLWNPCVKRHLSLVSSCFHKLLDKRKKWYYIVGLGFHEATNDFRVVRIVYNTDTARQFSQVVAKVEIFSVKTRTWRKIKDPVVPIIGSEYGTYVNGSYYWLEIEVGDGESDRDVWILSFDFNNEVFGEVKVPEEVCRCIRARGPSFKLMEFEGSLALCVSGVDYRNGIIRKKRTYCIWLMRYENGEISWTLRFEAILKKSGWPMNITKNGTLILESYHSDTLDKSRMLSCNLNTMKCKDLGFCKRGVSKFLCAPCIVDTSFKENLVMFEGGKSLLKYAQ